MQGAFFVHELHGYKNATSEAGDARNYLKYPPNIDGRGSFV